MVLPTAEPHDFSLPANGHLLKGQAVIASGAWLKNAACLLTHDHVYWSSMHGDLGEPSACIELEAALQKFYAFSQHHHLELLAVAHDFHPDFYSTQLAIDLAQRWQVPATAVQHHHAHIGVTMAEKGLNEAVIGLALDGVGLGTDGHAWGGELLLVKPGYWQRLGHLSPLQLPGGDIAAKEPWRMAVSALHALGFHDTAQQRYAPIIGEETVKLILTLLTKQFRCPTTSSAGRWFDAAAGLLGICFKQEDEAQAAILLEQLATDWLKNQHDIAWEAAYSIQGHGELDLYPLIPFLLNHPLTIGQSSLSATAAIAQAAARFHLTLAQALANWAIQAANTLQIQTIVLGGGCFFNRLLKTELTRLIEAAQLKVVTPQKVNLGDAGLALGQAWVAATTQFTHS